MAKTLGLTPGFLQQLAELPGTATTLDLKTRLVALSELNASMRK